MRNFEQISPIKEEKHCQTIDEILIREKELDENALLLELAYLKYTKGFGTMEMMKQISKRSPEIKDKLIRLLSIVALADLPDEEIKEAMADHPDKIKILSTIKKIKEYKEKITH